MTNPCVTLEQRWSACRDGYQPWLQWRAGIDTCLEWWGPPQRDIGHAWPCTSPRRHGCRAGLTQFHGYFTVLQCQVAAVQALPLSDPDSLTLGQTRELARKLKACEPRGGDAGE